MYGIGQLIGFILFVIPSMMWGWIKSSYGPRKQNMRGIRLYPSADFEIHQCKPGEYYLSPDGWRGCTPNGLFVWLKNHRVEEHQDGSISVMPPENSILASNGMGNKTWHGCIDHGLWEEC